jgi:hypothetical protein
MTTIQLGDKARDKITGFEGIVTGHCTYISGCDQILVAPPMKDGDFKESRWLDMDRCEVTESAAVALSDVSSAARPGPDKAAPRK